MNLSTSTTPPSPCGEAQRRPVAVYERERGAIPFIHGKVLVGEGFGHAWRRPEAYRAAFVDLCAPRWRQHALAQDVAAISPPVYATQLHQQAADAFTVAALQRFAPQLCCFWLPHLDLLVVVGELEDGLRDWRDQLLALDAPTPCVTPALVWPPPAGTGPR